MDEDIMNQTMAIYFERCKFKYTMAFFQWRSYRDKSDEKALQDIFEARLTILIDKLNQSKQNKNFAKKLTLILGDREPLITTQTDEEDPAPLTLVDRAAPKISQSGLMHIMAQVGINRRDEIQSFEEMGWFDPDLDPKKASQQTLNWLTNIKFSRDIYPDEQMDVRKIPTCIFVPQKQILRKIITTVASCETLE